MAEKLVTLATLKVVIDRLEKKIVTSLCKAIGIEKLADFRLRIEAVGNEIPARVDTVIESKLRDPGFVKALVEKIASDEEACSRLDYALEPYRRKRMDERTLHRRENLTAAVTNFYSKREPDVQLSDESVRALVERLDADHVVNGFRVPQYNEVVAKAIFAKEVEMNTLITSLCLSKAPKKAIEGTAVLLVLEGLPLKKDAVRARLEQDEDIKSFLKKN